MAGSGNLFISIYLTFDDGPQPAVTDKVLDILNEFNATATFFCVGENVSNHPEVYSRIVDEGHSTGNHTFNHLKGWHLQNDLYYKNIMKAKPYINGNLFRPPYGKIKMSQLKSLKKKNLSRHF